MEKGIHFYRSCHLAHFSHYFPGGEGSPGPNLMKLSAKFHQGPVEDYAIPQGL